jgi:hypothetical protein
MIRCLVNFVLALLLSCYMQGAWAIACSDIFTNGIQAHATNGNIKLEYHSILTGGTATLTAKTLTDNTSWVACSGSSCVATGTAATKSTPTFVTGNGANGAVNIGYQGSATITSGNYTTINVGQEGTLTFNTASGDYRTGALTTNYKSVLRMQSGDYWINGNLTIDQETVLRRIASSGPTRIFVNGNVSFGYKAYTDGFTSNQLLIYATGSISSTNELDFTGYLYAGGNVSLDFKSVVNGAVSGANFIALGNQVTVNYQGSNLASADFSPFCSGATVTPVLLGSWRMDEGGWNGTANEVIDSSGKGNHGRARIANGSSALPSTGSGNPAYTSGNQNTCYHGAFDGTGGSPTRAYSYVELTGFPSLPQGFTFAAWIKSTNASAQHQRILVRDDAQNGWGFSLADGTGQPKLRFFGRNITNSGAVTGQGSNPNCGVFCVDTDPVISSNAWHYVAAVVDTGGKTVTLYVYNQARTLLAKTSGAYSGTWTDGSGLAAIGGETSASSEGRDISWHFLGNIDEVNIYSGALTQTAIETLMQTVRTCAGPDHYELQIAAESLACEGANVTVRACANSAVPCSKDLSVNSNVQLQASAGSLNAATLTLSNGEATTKLLYPAAVENAVTALNFSSVTTAANNSAKCCTGTSSCSVAASCNTTFKRAGFVFSTSATSTVALPTQIAGTTDNNIFLRSVKSDNTTGACVARFTSPQTVQLAYKCINPTTCIAGQTLSLGGSSIQSNANSVADTSVTYSNKAVTFDTNGSAPIPFNYTDVGQVRLLARLALGASGGEPAYTFTGVSNDFVVKPFSLAVSAVTNSANAANPGTTNSGAGFVAAGEKFKVSVQARNAAGNPTPNFGKEIIPEIDSVFIASTLVYPAGGTPSPLINGGTFTATPPAGTFVNADIQWNQVGSITILPSLLVQVGNQGYLEQGAIPNYVASGTVGRFYPDHFTLSSSSLTDSCSGFSYMGQALPLTYTIEARAQDMVTKTSNYGPAYGTMPTVSYAAESENSGVDLGYRLLDGVAKTWANGALVVAPTSAVFSRLSAAPFMDGPYTNTQVGISLADTFDNRTLKNLDMNAGTTGTCVGVGCTAKTLGSSINIRYGRLRLDDAFGPETADLPVNFATEYWVGSFFAPNFNDNCTKILRSDIKYLAGDILTPANLTVALTGGNTVGNYGSMSATEVNFLSGNARQYFSAPSGSATGSFPVNVDLTNYSWLRFDWDQDGSDDDAILPTAHFGFGSYRGHDRVIYWRERFQ